MSAPAGFTTVSAAHLQDATGTVILNGTIYFRPVDNRGNPVSFLAGGAGGQVSSKPVQANVVSGAFSVVLADTSLTTPINVGYSVSCIDPNSGTELLGPGYGCVQPSGSVWSFDTYQPNLAAQITVQLGPTGPQGEVGPVGPIGNIGPQGVQGASGPQGAPGSSPNGVAITPLSVEIGNGIDVSLPASGGGSVWGITDSVGKVAITVTNDGKFHAPGGSVLPNATLSAPMIDNPTFSGTITMPAEEIGNAVESAMPMAGNSNHYALIDGMADSLGRLGGLQTLPDGSVWAPAGYKGLPVELTVARDGDDNTYYSQQDPYGYTQIYSDDGHGNIVQLTAGKYNNRYPNMSANGTLVVFVSDRVTSGTFIPYKMDRGGNVQVAIDSELYELAQLNSVFGIGQSLMMGAGGTPGLSTTEPLDNLMFSSNVRCAQDAGSAVPASNIAAFAALTEESGVLPNSDDHDGTTIMTSAFDTLALNAIKKSVHLRFLAAISGVSGTQYSLMAKGTQTYLNTLAMATAAKSIAADMGLTYGVRAMVCMHGEADSANPAYDQDLMAWCDNYNADLAAVTGQSYRFPLFIDQTFSWTHFADTSTAVSQLLQLKASQEYRGRIVLVGPRYFMSYADGTHLLGPSYQWWGEYFARAMTRVLLEGKLWRPISPRKITMIGASIYVRFWVPDGNSLVIDTSLVTPPTANPLGLNGFEYFDDSAATPAISSTTVISSDTVQIKLASAPTGTQASMRIRYAYTGTAGALAGPTTGARGCLRDNDLSVSAYGYANMYNWCVCFDDAIYSN